jgi:hypothetical protein
MRRNLTGISALTRAAIRRTELRLSQPNAVQNNLTRYRRLLTDGPRAHHDWLIDLGEIRDRLEEILDQLPSGARTDLERLIAPWDEKFLRRTAPVLRPPAWAEDGWWYQREL